MSKPVHFHDVVHGQIPIDSVALAVIEHRYFQRLRRIKALGFLDRVFPTARHSRFEHSIGVMHVAGLLLDEIERNSESLLVDSWSKESGFVPNSTLRDGTRKWRPAIALAALLHDVGHGPFSHASEVIMPPAEDLWTANKIPDYLRDALVKRAKKEGADGDHEDYSAIMIWRILNETRPEIDQTTIRRVLSLKLADYIDFENEEEKKWAKVFCQLVDGEFDADRMDYLLRDSFFCGVPYGKFDFDRLKEGLAILYSEKKDEFTLAIRRSSLTAFEHFLFARFQMHVQIYTHRVDTSFNEALKTIIKNRKLTLPADVEEYSKVDDESFVFKFSGDANLENLILRRNKWSVVFEAFNPDYSLTGPIVAKLVAEIPNGSWSKKESEKPIRKESLLKLPVISKDFLGRLCTQEVKAISDLVSHYNTTFNVLRFVVHPDSVHIAKRVLDLFSLPEPSPEEMNKTASGLGKLGSEIGRQEDAGKKSASSE